MLETSSQADLKMDDSLELNDEIAELYNQILESIENSKEFDDGLRRSLENKLVASGNKKAIGEFRKVFQAIKEEKEVEEKCLASKKKVTKKTKQTNRDFEVSFSDLGRFLSRILPPIKIKYSRTTVKETVTEEIIEDDDEVDARRKQRGASGIGWNV